MFQFCQISDLFCFMRVLPCLRAFYKKRKFASQFQSLWVISQPVKILSWQRYGAPRFVFGLLLRIVGHLALQKKRKSINS